ncbi:MAG: GNAT family N-acetyltransferase [Terracidiphilus sp.]|jgi:GNAT superfamily N-acetyltransferase
MALEIRTLSPEWEYSLAKFFSCLQDSADQYFHPHPLTDEYAHRLARYSGADSYYLVVHNGAILAYGMLRGWDEGYEVPSLGIVVHPDHRGNKLGELLMLFLHAVARHRGAKAVRLKVYRENTAARDFYLRLGYAFDAENFGEQMIGILTL